MHIMCLIKMNSKQSVVLSVQIFFRTNRKFCARKYSETLFLEKTFSTESDKVQTDSPDRRFTNTLIDQYLY